MTTPQADPTAEPLARYSKAQTTTALPMRVPTRGELLRFALPMMAGLLTMSLNTLIDVLFIGRLGTSALAAVPLAGIVYLIPGVLMQGLMRNAIAFCGRAHGAGRDGEIGGFLAQYRWLVLPAIPLLVLYGQAWPFFAWLGAVDAAVSELAQSYLLIRAWDIAPVMLVALYVAFYQAIGKTRFPMLIYALILCTNALLDYGLIFGHFGLPALGVEGSALATVLAQSLGALAIMWATHSGRLRARFGLRLWARPNPALLGSILRVGLPQGLGDMADLGTWSAFTLIVGHLGREALAATNIGMQLTQVIFLPGYAVGLAGASYMSRFLGAGRPDLAKAATVRSLWLAATYMGVMGLPLWFLGERIAATFTTDAGVIWQAGLMFRVMAVYQVIDCLGFVTRTTLGGAGDTRVPFLMLLASTLGVMLPGAWVLARVVHPPIVGAWLGACAFMLVYAVLMLRRLHGGRWMHIVLHTTPRADGLPPTTPQG